MARPAKRRRVARIAKPVPLSIVFWMLTGNDAGHGKGLDPFALYELTESAKRRLWNEHEDEWLALWLATYEPPWSAPTTYGGPGTRPSAWWIYTAPEPRQQLEGPGAPLWERYPAVMQQYAFGLPSIAGGPATFESEASYLRRLGLFQPRERGRVPASAYTPVTVTS